MALQHELLKVALPYASIEGFVEVSVGRLLVPSIRAGAVEGVRL